MMKNFARAIQIAANAHYGQFDKAGQPYIMHLMKVAHYVREESEDTQCVAILHDILEDTDITTLELMDAGFSKNVIQTVLTLTKDDNISYDEYIMNISDNPIARKVKMADLRHNMDIRRIKGVTDKDLARLSKYAKAYNFLKNIT